MGYNSQSLTSFKGFLHTNNSYPLARVFPYGGWKIKKAGKQDYWSLSGARRAALRSISDETTKIETTKNLENFVHSSYGSSPPRFPVLLFTGKNSCGNLSPSMPNGRKLYHS